MLTFLLATVDFQLIIVLLCFILYDETGDRFELNMSLNLR